MFRGAPPLEIAAGIISIIKLRALAREGQRAENVEDAVPFSTETEGWLKQPVSKFRMDSVIEKVSGSVLGVVRIVDWDSFRRQKVVLSRELQGLG